jgi:WD40 repeat protein
MCAISAALLLASSLVIASDKASQQADIFGDPLPAGAVARFGTTRLRHPGGSPSLAFSADGTTLVSGNADGAVRIWDLATGRQIHVFQTTDDYGGQYVALSPDGRLLAAGGRDGIRVWEFQTRKELNHLKGTSVRSLVFTPDSKMLISGGQDGDHSVRVWDLAKGKERKRFLWHQREIDYLALTPDGNTLVTASRYGSLLYCADLNSGKEVLRIGSRSSPMESVALSPDGKHVVLGGNRGSRKNLLRIVELSSGKEIRSFSIPEKINSIDFLAFSPDGAKLATSSYRDVVRLWNIETGQLTRKIDTDAKTSGCRIAFSPNGTLMATHAGDSSIRLWEVESGKELLARDGHTGSVNWLSFAPDMKALASCSFQDQTVRIWDLHTGKQLRVLHHEEYVRSVAYLPDAKTLLSGGGDSFLHVWDASTGKELRRMALHEDDKKKQQVATMTLSSDGKRALAFSTGFEPEGKAITSTWDVTNGKRLARFTERYNHFDLDCPAGSPDGRMVARRARNEIVIHDAITNKELLRIKGEDINRSPILFSPDNKLLAVRTSKQKRDGNGVYNDDYAIRFYEVATGKEVSKISATGYRAVVFSPDGKRLATTTDDGLAMYSVVDGKELKRWNGLGSNSVMSLAFAPDGQRLAAGLANSTILFWDLD